MTRCYPYLYRCVQSLLLTILALTLVSLVYPFGNKALVIFIIYSIGVIIFWEFARATKYKKELFAGILLVCILAFFALYRNREWVIELYQSYQPELLLLLAIIPFTFVLSLLRERLYWLAGIGILFLLYAAVTELDVHQLGIAAAYSFVLLSLIEISSRRLYGKKLKQEKLAGLIVAPICLALCLSVLPVSERPYPFTILKQMWHQLQESANILYAELSLFINNQNNGFYVHFSGYDQGNTIGGSLLNSDKPALTISVPSNLHGNLYLTGNIQNHYEENSWSYVAADDSANSDLLQYDTNMDYLELLYALYETDNFDEERAYIWHTSANVTYNGLYTRDMFFPLKLYEFKRIEDYSSLGNKFIASHTLKEGDSFSFRYTTLNYGSPELDRLLESRSDKVYRFDIQENSEFSSKIRRSYPTLRDEVPLEGFEALLAEREHMIRQNYMQIPEYLHEDILTLTKEVTKNAVTDYDKLKAIEAYLQNFTYTQTPSSCDGDAVHNFLFNTKEGYCTYFASAFVLMSRAADIPARYVNGFCVPVYTEEQSEFVVGSDCAHAWPEAYLTGFGWISFEPTAGYAQYHDTPWRYVPASEADKPEDTEITQEEEIQPEEDDLPEETEEETEEETVSKKALLSAELTVSITKIAVICLILLPIVTVLICVLRLYSRRRRYLRSKEEQKLAALLYYELLLLKSLGTKRESNETLLQYEKKVLEKYPELTQEGFSDLIHSYMQSFYGMDKPTEASLETAIHCVQKTEQYYRGIRKLWLYVLRLQSINENL